MSKKSLGEHLHSFYKYRDDTRTHIIASSQLWSHNILGNFKMNLIQTRRAVAILFVGVLSLTSPSTSESLVNPLEYLSAKQEWIKAADVIQAYTWPYMESFSHFLDKIIIDDSIDLDSECRVGLYDFSSGLKSLSHEAVSMFDSFAKMQAGFTRDRIVDFGHYDQCLHSTLNGSATRYVVLQLEFPLPQDYRITKFDNDVVNPRNPPSPWFIKYSERISFLRFWPSLTAVCLPSKCRSNDIENILNSTVVYDYISPMKLKLYATESLDDDISHSVPHPLLRRISRLILFSFTALTILSTLAFYFMPDLNNGSSNGFLVHFDAIKNTKKLIAPSTANNNMYIFNVFKTVYLFAAILCHVYSPIVAKLYGYFTTLAQYAVDTDFRHDFEWENYSVAINFVTSGCMASLSLLPILKTRKVSLPKAVLLRALRTLPVVSACILFTLSFPLTKPGAGPLSTLAQINMTDNCVKNAWRELTFTSNFVPITEMCVPVTWFNSADMQLFILSFFLIGIMATGTPKQVLKYSLLFLIGSCVSLAAFLQFFNVYPVLFVIQNDWFTVLNTSAFWIQFNTITYAGPYACGLILGYLINKEIFILDKKNFKYFLILCLGTIFAISTFLRQVYDVSNGIRSNYSRTVELLFASTSRTIGCAAFAGVLYVACMIQVKTPEEKEKQAGQEAQNEEDHPLISLLKHNIFNIISRLSFSIFMIHVFVIVLMQSTYRTVPDFNATDITMKGVYVSVVSFVPGLLMYLIVEAPFFNIVKSNIRRRNSIKTE